MEGECQILGFIFVLFLHYVPTISLRGPAIDLHVSAEGARRDRLRSCCVYERKSAQQLSYGFNILDKLESCPHENQIPYGDMDFSKKVSKVVKKK